jgi:hypothetical protein
MACRGNCHQGRKDCPHPVQCERGLVSQALTDFGLLDDAPPDADDYTSEPITSAERVVLLIIAASSVAGVVLLVTSCIT